MKMIFRWFGGDNDSVPLGHIKQVPSVEGVAGALLNVPVGDVWPMDQIISLKQDIVKKGLSFEVVESVNVHEDIKLGRPTRDKYIENYKQTLQNLSKAGVKVVCYNFMPV